MRKGNYYSVFTSCQQIVCPEGKPRYDHDGQNPG